MTVDAKDWRRSVMSDEEAHSLIWTAPKGFYPPAAGAVLDEFVRRLGSRADVCRAADGQVWMLCPGNHVCRPAVLFIRPLTPDTTMPTPTAEELAQYNRGYSAGWRDGSRIGPVVPKPNKSAEERIEAALAECERLELNRVARILRGED